MAVCALKHQFLSICVFPFRCLYTCDSSSSFSSPPDLLVRTSGEVRLSDFLLWQSSYSVTHFTQVLWPEFSLHHLLAAVFHYQSKQLYIQELLGDGHSGREDCSGHEDESKSRRVADFLQVLDKEANEEHTANSTDDTSLKNYEMTSIGS